MFSFIRTWFNTIITALNAVVTIDLIEITNFINPEHLSDVQMDYNYLLKLDETDMVDDTETQDEDIIKVKVYFWFTTSGKGVAVYTTIIDSYVYALRKYLKDQSTTALSQRTSGTLRIEEIRSVRCFDLDKYEGDYFVPKVEFELKTRDV